MNTVHLTSEGGNNNLVDKGQKDNVYTYAGDKVEQLQKTIPFYRGRLLVRPGITGWAQINYGYASGAEQNAVKLEYDLYYIKRRSLPLDISILFKTVKSVFGLKGR